MKKLFFFLFTALVVAAFDFNPPMAQGMVFPIKMSNMTDIPFLGRGVGLEKSRVIVYPSIAAFEDVLKEPAERTDQEIKQSIQGELRSSPFLGSHEVTVGVKKGVATLTGTVDNWTAYADAEANAFQGGAKGVRNHLKVRKSPMITHHR